MSLPNDGGLNTIQDTIQVPNPPSSLEDDTEDGVSNRLAMGKLSLSSQTMHADDHLNTYADIAPAMHVSTTFRYTDDPDKLVAVGDFKPGDRYPYHIYSRYTTPNTTRLESILTSILHGPTLTYSSGLSAFHAILTFLNPSKISIGDGYHGCHGVISLVSKLSGLEKIPLDCPAEDLGPGDIVHIETPINPTGLAFNLKEYAEKAHSRGAYLVVDSTFGPPPLQDPFVWGADLVMHSGTKYFGGHSDMLCGVLAINPKHCVDPNKTTSSSDAESSKEEEKSKGKVQGNWWAQMEIERMFLGSVMGNMEGWLGIRSIRTLELRIQRQSYNVGKLVAWLDDQLSSPPSPTNPMPLIVHSIQHASIQQKELLAQTSSTTENSTPPPTTWLAQQMPNGFSPVFSILLKTPKLAKSFPSKLKLFHHGTSLGGVESLIEWRAMSDSSVDRRLLRVSVGVEGWEDLRDDLVGGMRVLVEEGGLGGVGEV